MSTCWPACPSIFWPTFPYLLTCHSLLPPYLPFFVLTATLPPSPPPPTPPACPNRKMLLLLHHLLFAILSLFAQPLLHPPPLPLFSLCLPSLVCLLFVSPPSPPLSLLDSTMSPFSYLSFSLPLLLPFTPVTLYLFIYFSQPLHPFYCQLTPWMPTQLSFSSISLLFLLFFFLSTVFFFSLYPFSLSSPFTYPPISLFPYPFALRFTVS